MGTRREWLLAAAGLIGCATPGRPLEEGFPRSVAGGWTLQRSTSLRPDEAAEDVRPALRRAARAEYSGPVPMAVTLNELKSSGNAFELLQKWRPAEGRMAFQHGRYFGVAESPGAPHLELQRFVDAFEKAFTGR